MTKLAILFHRLGPYHHARLKVAGQRLHVTCIEMCGMDKTYAWDPVAGAEQFERVTLFPDARVSATSAKVRRRVRDALDAAQPTVVAIPGWSANYSCAALAWCASNRVPCVIMSDSQEMDAPRAWWSEAIKKQVVQVCGAGLVAGRRHEDYMAALGMPRERIFTGYDVVDNAHFAAGAEEARRDATGTALRLGLPCRYFLACNRLVEKKNLATLLEAYAQYQTLVENTGVPRNERWHLVILGDGELRLQLETLRHGLGLDESVLMPGFKQYPDLPAYYGLAGAFIHASTPEQWGLVVNEAMAAGLPVLVSERCGCAPDLVEEGKNGFVFDPRDATGLAWHMARMANGEYDRLAMGAYSRRIIAGWTPERFAGNLLRAAEVSIAEGGKAPSLLQGLILRARSRWGSET